MSIFHLTLNVKNGENLERNLTGKKVVHMHFSNRSDQDKT